jgi:CubicO group peptidase (beta-lactamase class C family)
MRRALSMASPLAAGAALGIMLAPTAWAQSRHDLAGEIRDSVEAWRSRNQQPTGLVVGVYWRGEAILTQATGSTRLGSTTPVTARTIFHLASVTKPFVAAAVMQLVEQGRVDIEAPLTRYVPYFKMNDPRASSITVKQLLTHTAGMPDVTDYRWEQPEYDGASLERYVRALADSTLVFDPGTRWQYSNIGFEVLAELIAQVSGEPFEAYMQRHIFTPLGMTHTTLLMTDVDSANLARGHVRASSGQAVLSSVYPYNRPHAASSTLHSDLTDMLRWVAANLRKGELEGHRILPVAAIDQMWTMAYDRTAEFSERARRSGRPMRYASIGQALGWRVFTLQGQDLVSHGGADVGFRSDVLLWPAQSSAVVVMMNDEAGNPGELSQIIYSILLSEPIRHKALSPR